MSVNFQIHHIFPVELYNQFGVLLSRAGFSREATGNKIGLLVEQSVIDVLRDIPGVKDILALSGFGLGVHKGSHPQYSNFLSAEFAEINAEIMAGRLSPENARLVLDFTVTVYSFPN